MPLSHRFLLFTNYSCYPLAIHVLIQIGFILCLLSASVVCVGDVKVWIESITLLSPVSPTLTVYIFSGFESFNKVQPKYRLNNVANGTTWYGNKLGEDANNPLHYDFDQWRGNFFLRFEAWQGNEHAVNVSQQIRYEIPRRRPYFMEPAPVGRGYIMQTSTNGSDGRTYSLRVQLNVSISCSPKWYGNSCSKFCDPTVKNTTCDDEGFQICIPNSNCFLDGCDNSLCENKGFCKSINGVGSCFCPENFHGIHCEILEKEPSSSSQTTVAILVPLGIIVVLVALALFLWRKCHSRNKLRSSSQNYEDKSINVDIRLKRPTATDRNT